MRFTDNKDYSNISVVIQGTPPRKEQQSQKQQKNKSKMQVTSNASIRAAATTQSGTRRRNRDGSKGPVAGIWKTLRFVVLDAPLALLFATLLSVYAIRNIYQDLYLPLMNRSTRTDGDLESEFTYYHRYCTEADMTTRNIHDLVVDDKAPVARGVQQMMEHGAVVIRDLLKQDTLRKLREYAVYRNTHIPEEEEYPVSQGHNRMSFGYDATEHPIVVQALQELANNRYLKELLAEILGDVSSLESSTDAHATSWTAN